MGWLLGCPCMQTPWLAPAMHLTQLPLAADAMRAIGLQQTGAAGGQPAAPVLASVPDALASAAEDMVHGYVNGNPSERLESAGRSRLERALRLGEGVGQAEGEAERQAAVLQELSEVPAARLGRIAAVAAGKILEDERLEPAKRKVSVWEGRGEGGRGGGGAGKGRQGTATRKTGHCPPRRGVSWDTSSCHRQTQPCYFSNCLGPCRERQ
jgi:hypothetical protein